MHNIRIVSAVKLGILALCCLNSAALPATKTLSVAAAKNQEQISLSKNPKIEGLYRAAYPPRHGAIILLHDRQQHADWPYVIGPLRKRLPNYGWSTLALQLPVAPMQNQTTAPAVPAADSTSDPPLLQPYLQAALAFLSQKQNKRIVLLVFGGDGQQILQALQTQTSVRATALILIGVDWSENLLPITQMPLLDILGSKDYVTVLRGARKRKQFMRMHGAKRYLQRIFAGSEHDFSAAQAALQRRIRGWLQRVFKLNQS